MAVEWKRSPNYTWPDDSVTINDNQSTDVKCVVDVPQGAACGQYWVLYKNNDNGTICTGETYFTVTGDCGGGGSCDEKINVFVESGDPTLQEGGTVKFGYCAVLGRTLNADDSGTQTIGTVPHGTSGWSFEVLENPREMIVSNPQQPGAGVVDVIANISRNDGDTRIAKIKATCTGAGCGNCEGEYTFDVKQAGSGGGGDHGISIKLVNKYSQDIYITGRMVISVGGGTYTDYAPITIEFRDGVSKGNVQLKGVTHEGAGYYVKRGKTATLSSDLLKVTVAEDEPLWWFYGNDVYVSRDNPVYWRVFSWTDAHDPAVVVSTPGDFNFTNGGMVVFNLDTIDSTQGTITPTQDAVDISD